MPSTSTAALIARTARATLGRPARRRRNQLDWPAIDAVRAAAHQHGLTGELLGWARPDRALSAIAGDYAWRYSQAYGVRDGLPHANAAACLVTVATATR